LKKMKFKISRTSHGYSQHEPPCEHPTLKDETPEEDRIGDAEDYPHVWTVEISDLGEIFTLSKASPGWAGRNHPWPNRVIVGPPNGDGGELPTIEIYDAYRE
jgi:hypothetical protein